MQLFFLSVGNLILIETYWNVKELAFDNNNLISLILIETYWNVKINEGVTSPENFNHINRDILECKE